MRDSYALTGTTIISFVHNGLSKGENIEAIAGRASRQCEAHHALFAKSTEF